MLRGFALPTLFWNNRRMCVLAVAWKAHPHWMLVVAANRDERHDRPAEPLHLWDDRAIIAGRDLTAGGSWLAVSPAGRFAAVTNRHGYGLPDPARASRGALVADLADGAMPSVEAVADFNPFNALVVTPDHARFMTNRPDAALIDQLPGLHAISNGPLDPPWRKTARLSMAIDHWLPSDNADPEPLFTALADTSPPSHTADDPAPIFVLDPVYGTRCSTVVLVDAARQGRIIERRFSADGTMSGETSLTFAWG